MITDKVIHEAITVIDHAIANPSLNLIESGRAIGASADAVMLALESLGRNPETSYQAARDLILGGWKPAVYNDKATRDLACSLLREAAYRDVPSIEQYGAATKYPPDAVRLAVKAWLYARGERTGSCNDIRFIAADLIAEGWNP